MFQMTHLRIAAAVLGFAAAGSPAALAGQVPGAPAAAASAPPGAIGSGSFSPIVANLQKTLAFYALLGIEVPKGSDVAPQPFSVNPRLHSMLGTNGANERHVNARVPGGFTLEPIEFGAIGGRPARPRIQDPGAITVVLYVRDVDALLARAVAAGVPVLTPGGKPVARADRTRAVLITDPDGRPFELRQADPLPQTAAPATSNVIGSRITMTVANTDRTIRLYRDTLRFAVDGKPGFTADPDLPALAGVKGGEVRHSTLAAPGGRMTIELLEFKGLDGTPLRSRMQDPGSARIQVRVNQLDTVLEQVIAATGSQVTTTTEKPVALPPNFRGVIVPDYDNLYLTMIAPCDGPCAPREEAGKIYVATGQESWYGTWKLNPGKSKYVNGAPTSRSTVTKVEPWEGGIQYSTETVNAQGQTLRSGWRARFDRKDYPLANSPAIDSYEIQQIDDRTYTVIAKKNGLRLTTSTSTVSADGKTRTVRQRGEHLDGQVFDNTLVYDRQ